MTYTRSLTMSRVIAAWALVFAVASARAVDVELETVEGETFTLTDIAWSVDGTISGQWKVEPLSVARDRIDAVRFPAAQMRVASTPALLIPGGRIVHGQILEATEESIKISNELFGTAEFPLSSIEGILLVERRLVPDAKEAIVRRIRSVEREADALVLSNGDILQGAITSFGPGDWKIDRDGNVQTVASSFLEGAALDRNFLEYEVPTGPHWLVRLTDGSLLAAQSLKLDGTTMEVATVAGPVLRIPCSADDTSGILSIEQRGGRLVYLSDMEPKRIEVRPFLDDALPPRMDASAIGTPIQLGAERFSKGIGARSFTRIDYDAAGFEKFLAKIGVDQAAGESASLICRVLVDGQPAFDSGELTSNSAPVAVAVPLMNAQVVSLVVDYGKRGDMGDLADWASARFLRPEGSVVP